MGFIRFFARIAQRYSIPVFKSFFKAYQETTANPRSSQSSSSNSSGKKHPLDQLFKKFLSQQNLSAPPLDYLTAMKILNIEVKEGDKKPDPRVILERYYTLYKKNDPQSGGTAYLQSKIFSAKETIMNQYPNATEVEQQFYKEVVEPQQKAQEQKKQKQKQQQDKKKELKNENTKQKVEKKQKEEKEKQKKQ